MLLSRASYSVSSALDAFYDQGPPEEIETVNLPDRSSAPSSHDPSEHEASQPAAYSSLHSWVETQWVEMLLRRLVWRLR